MSALTDTPPLADAQVQTTAARLITFFAVQNTYLSTFRSLGGLGLLLGTFGLAAAQLRSMVERRGELALMQACGFRRRRLSQLILIETAALLVAGLAIGSLAAIVVLLPHLLAGGAAMMAIAGVLFFREAPSWQRIVGIAFAILDLFLLRK